jgi:hypothetical protein
MREYTVTELLTILLQNFIKKIKLLDCEQLLLIDSTDNIKNSRKNLLKQTISSTSN